jgi:hypothetical protein
MGLNVKLFLKIKSGIIFLYKKVRENIIVKLGGPIGKAAANFYIRIYFLKQKAGFILGH